MKIHSGNVEGKPSYCSYSVLQVYMTTIASAGKRKLSSGVRNIYSKVLAHFRERTVDYSGQSLVETATEELKNLPPNPTLQQKLFIKYRKFTAALIPFLLVQVQYPLLYIGHILDSVVGHLDPSQLLPVVS